MSLATWQVLSGRLSTLGASTLELAAIQASYFAATTDVQGALDTLVASLANADLLVMLNTWRTSGSPFHAGLPGGGLPFGTGVAVLTGNPADDTSAISSGTGRKLSSAIPNVMVDASGNGTFDWSVVKEGPLNVQWAEYGAKGDGTTDDAAAIQAAINVALNGQSGGAVFFPKTAASYLVSQALITGPHVRLIGEQSRADGSVASRIKAGASGVFSNGNYNGVFMLKDVAASSDAWHGGSIERLGFDCNNVAGLGAIHLWSPGEGSLIEWVNVVNTGVTARTVNDAVTNGTTTVTSATAAFTADDVNAVVTGTNIPANTKIDIVNSATSVTLRNAASGSGSGGSLTVNRPADAIVFDGAAPTGVARSISGSNMPGALLRLKNLASGSWVITSLSGDANIGGLLRISHGSAGADPTSVTVLNIKSENGNVWNRQDPVVLLDNCDMVALNIIGGSFQTLAANDIVRIDQPVTARGGPSVHLVGLEGSNPFNAGYANVIRDTSTGNAIAASPPGSNHLYPDILWGRSLLMGGGVGGASIVTPKAALTQAATVTPDALAGEWQTLTVTTNAAVTIAAPSNPPNANQNAELTIEVLNSSGGAMGAITWNAAFVFQGLTWTNPASTKKRFARFEWNGANWICTSLASADY